MTTADLRLSVLLGATASGGSCGGPAAGRLVHGTARGELAPVAAQRVVAITGDGDQGLIVLSACQSYIKKVVGRRYVAGTLAGRFLIWFFSVRYK